jgi:hypothetical protein
VASLAVDNVSTLDLGSIEDAFAAFTKAYPKLFALSQAAEAAGLSISGVRIVAHTENRMRAGRRHVKGATDYPVTEFTPAQLEQLLDDPAFTVELI